MRNLWKNASGEAYFSPDMFINGINVDLPQQIRVATNSISKEKIPGTTVNKEDDVIAS